MKLAVAIMSFNRPHYFEQVLQSINEQTDKDVDFYLFQDGCINKYSWRKCANQNDINKCVELYEYYIPKGKIHIHDTNVGTAENFNKAEEVLFEDYDYDSILFLEDDLVLSPWYISIIKKMLEAYSYTEVGMVCAYGDHNIPIEAQFKYPNMVKPIDHLWGYATTKDSWKQRKPYYDEWYNKFIKGKDYVTRDHNKIFEWYNKLGFKSLASSQDAARTIAMLRADQVGIATVTNNGEYIGHVGQHGNNLTDGMDRPPFTEDVGPFIYREGTMIDILIDLDEKWRNDI
tara:strand:+ start:2659 stop:3519 length:861 start_codon:yes stop_codon:yes gene_type:complete